MRRRGCGSRPEQPRGRERTTRIAAAAVVWRARVAGKNRTRRRGGRKFRSWRVAVPTIFYRNAISPRPPTVRDRRATGRTLSRYIRSNANRAGKRRHDPRDEKQFSPNVYFYVVIIIVRPYRF